MEEWIEQNGEFDKSKAEWKQSERKMLESLSLDKYWEYLLALKAIDDNTIGDWVGKAIEAGYLESVVHQYFMAKSEKLEVSDYTQQEQERFEIRNPYFFYKDLGNHYTLKNKPHIFVPYGIFSKTFCESYIIGEWRYEWDGNNDQQYWYPVILPNSGYINCDEPYYLGELQKQYNYQPINYKDITQKVLHTYMPKCKDFLGKEFMQTSFKILCNRQVEF
ncbi:hypothetical protein [Helicobacter cinaedi]|nr:hypothetical protein [Helicobacter cinaedi]STP08592.1 Uncharacterised protein [Helicobacter cinaedi]